MKLIPTTEHSTGDFYFWNFKTSDGDKVSVEYSLYERPKWTVVWNGAVDFEGNKKDMLKRYPELKKLI